MNIFSWSVDGLFIFLAEEMTFDDVRLLLFPFLIRAFFVAQHRKYFLLRFLLGVLSA